jgi:hypothetical protein
MGEPCRGMVGLKGIRPIEVSKRSDGLEVVVHA